MGFLLGRSVLGSLIIFIIDVLLHGVVAVSFKRRPVMSHLMATQVPLVFAFFVAQVALHPLALGVNIDNVLFQIEFVAEDAVTYGTDAWLTAVPKLGNACPHQIFSVCKGRRNVLSVWLSLGTSKST